MAGPPTGTGLLRSSRTMALGTVASRVTGFLRNAVIAAVVGSALLGNAYNLANTLPNVVYELMLGGVLTSVVVPLLVAARSEGEEAGEAYAQRMLTTVAIGLAAVTVLAVLAAPWLMRAYGDWRTDDQYRLGVAFARVFLVQIFFYGVGATVGAVLNTRGRFGAPMWTPVLNNLVVIVTGLLFVLERPVRGSVHLGTGPYLTLAVGTTLGIVVQTAALLPGLRASGFRLRARLDLRWAELRDAGRVAGWVLVYVLANQVGLFIVIRLTQAAGNAAGPGVHAGYPSYTYAFTLFSLPHAVVAVSVITALLPRMSRAVVERRPAALAADVAGGLRLAAVILVPSAVAFLALGPRIATVVYAHGLNDVADARRIGLVLGGFALGLVPFSCFQVYLRAFYALHDTRTPALVNIAVNAANVVVDLVLYALLPADDRVVGLAVGYSASYAVGLALLARLLAGRVPAGTRQNVVRTMTRLAVAAVLGGLVAVAVAAVLGAVLGDGFWASIVVLLVALPAGGAGYLLAAARMRVPELATVAALVPGGRRLRLG